MGINPLSANTTTVVDLPSRLPNQPTTNSVATPVAGTPVPGVSPQGARPEPMAGPGTKSAKSAAPPEIFKTAIGPEFQWNDTVNRLVVVMKDRSTGSVVQQLPPQQVLELVEEATKRSRDTMELTPRNAR